MLEMRSSSLYKRMKLKTDIQKVVFVLVLICIVQFSFAATNPTDVAAINRLYAALGNPVLPGWVASAGDPCGEAWQGVQCNDSLIQEITLIGANLGGVLGDSLGPFVSIKSISLRTTTLEEVFHQVYLPRCNPFFFQVTSSPEVFQSLYPH